MKRLGSILLVFLLVFSACKDSETYIDVETMASIIMDSKKAEAFVQTSYPDNNGQEEFLQQFNADILKKHNVSLEFYQSSLDFYKSNPKEMEKLVNCLKHKRAKE